MAHWDFDTVRSWIELISYLVTAIGLPFAVAVFIYEQKKERENEEEEAYQRLSDAYIDFLKVVLNNADLQLRTRTALPEPTPEQRDDFVALLPTLLEGEDPEFSQYLLQAVTRGREGL
jgi:hypothetical protein